MNSAIDQEIGLLEKFNNTTINKTHQEYINLEIKLLKGEHDTYSTVINKGTSYSSEVTSKATYIRQIKDDIVSF